MSFLYDTAGHPFEKEPWFVGKVGNKDITHQRLLERGNVGDFVIRESERGGYTLICKIKDDKLSYPHLAVHDDGTFQMEGSKFSFPAINELLSMIKMLAKRPAREVVIDSIEEDSYLDANADVTVDYDFSSADRSAQDDAGGYFDVSPIYDDASGMANLSLGNSEPTYDTAQGGAPAPAEPADYDDASATAAQEADYDDASATATQEALYDDASGNVGGGDPVYDVGTGN